MKPRLLILGDNEHAIYHPLAAVETELKGMLCGSFDLSLTEDYTVLEEEGLLSYDALIAYTDRWKAPVTDAQASGLIRYVEQGGGLVVLHTGISLSLHEELFKLIGARFTGHPPYQQLRFEPLSDSMGSSGTHPVIGSLTSFTSVDEPYRYKFADNLPELDIILQYQHEGSGYPAGWVRSRGQGRLVSLMPGHDKASLQEPQVRKLIVSGCAWAAGGKA